MTGRRFGSHTICPVCSQEAHLVSSRTIGRMWHAETRTRELTVERRIECPCAPPGNVHVVHKIELYRGPSPVWTVNLPGRVRHNGKGKTGRKAL